MIPTHEVHFPAQDARKAIKEYARGEPLVFVHGLGVGLATKQHWHRLSGGVGFFQSLRTQRVVVVS